MRRITPEDIKMHGVVNAPDKLQGTAHENKMIFDRLIREVVAGAINAVIDRFEEFQGVEQIRDQAEKDRQEAEAARQEAEALRQNTFRQEVEEARSYKEEAEEAADRVGNTADDSEAWAVGQRNGVDVSSLDPAYRNNAKFYKDQAKAIVGGDDVFVFHSIVVPQELWTASLRYEDFPWEATVAAKDVTEQHVPFVVFDHVDAATYGLATVADTGEGTLTIYSVTKPTTTFTIPATVFMAENVIPGKEALRQALEEALEQAIESGVFDGPPGPQGPAGEDGVSPVATVESIEGGHRVTITDAEGPKSFDVMNGKDGSGTGGGSGGGVSKASELDNDLPFVSAVEQCLTDDQKAQARVNIGAATVDIEYQNIGSASFVLFDITDGNGESHHLQWSKDPAKPKDGGVWVPQFNEETSMLEWDYYQADALYPVPMPTPVGIPIPDKTSDLENDSEFVELPTMQQSIKQVYDTTNVFIPQNPTEEQKAQARENIGVESVPNIKTAAVGQTIVVSEVDAAGKPTKWEAATIGATAPSATLGCMLDLFKKALYVEDTSDLLSELEKLIGTGGGDSGGSDTPEVPDLPDEPEPVALPSWIQEMQVVEFTPEADTNEVQTFAISMENEPNMVIVRSDIETPTNIRDFVGMFAIKTLSETYAWTQYISSATTAITGAMQPIANDISFSNSAISVQSYVVGGNDAYWRAGHKYTAYCIRTTFDVSDMTDAPFAKETYAVTYEPEADSNEAVTFEYEMENEPNCVLIISDHTAKETVRDVVGYLGTKLYADEVWRSMNLITTSSAFAVNSGVDGGSTGGYVAVNDGVLTYTPYKYGSTACYFRAARKYMVIMMHI